MPEFKDPDDDIARMESGSLVWLDKSKRVLGYLYVTEHNNYGDVQWETAIEPAARTRKTAIGGEGLRVARETHMVMLFSTYRCRVAFVPDGEDIANAEQHAFPLAPETETPRLVHMNTAMTVVAFPDY